MNNLKTFLSLSLIMIVLSGCTITFDTVKSIQVLGKEKTKAIDIKKTFYIPQGVENNTKTMGGNVYVNNVIYNAFLTKQQNTIQGSTPETEKEALISAKQKQLDYMVYSRVTEWADPFYFNCGIRKGFAGTYDVRDIAAVEISVYDVKTSTVVNLYKLYSAGCPNILLSIIPVGVTTPEGRFNRLFSKWIKENTTK